MAELWRDYIHAETPDGCPEVIPVRMLDDGTAEEFNGSPEWGGTNEWVPLQERHEEAFREMGMGRAVGIILDSLPGGRGDAG